MLLNLFTTFQKVTISLAFVAVAFISNAQDYPISVTPSVDPFSMDIDERGDPASSINTFTGEVQFGLNLISTSLSQGIGLNISYSSNVQHTVENWNLDNPTGPLGLGWSLDLPHILVNKKETGTELDDSYYLIQGGVSQELVYTHINGSVETYVPKTNHLWKVEYNKTTKQWTVIDENGNTLIYGGETGRGTLDYGVKWGNWMGSSVQTTNAEQYVRTYKLAQLTDKWGSSFVYTYVSFEESVAGVNYTRESYLNKIEGPAGDYIELFYADKILDDEFVEPHQEQPEPDAYQEFYETKYLERLESYTPTNRRFQITTLTYDVDLIGSGNMRKRLLTGITKTYADGDTTNPMVFEYLTIGARKGALSRVIAPNGVTTDYSYSTGQEVAFSNRVKDLPAITGYGEPGVAMQGEDYVVVVWRELNSDGSHSNSAKSTIMKILTWEGGWREYSGTIGDVAIRNDVYLQLPNKDYHTYLLTQQRDFFAVLNWNENTTDFDLLIYSRDPDLPGNWIIYEDANIDLSASWSLRFNPVLISGENFVAIGDRYNGNLRTYTWKGSTWQYENHAPTDTPELYHYTGKNNWVIRHSTRGGDKVEILYLDKELKWNTKDFPAADVCNSDGVSDEQSYWYAGDNFAIALVDDCSEFIYRWDEDFNVWKDYTIPPVNDKSFVESVNNSLALVVADNATYFYRFDGDQWYLKQDGWNGLGAGTDIQLVQDQYWYNGAAINRFNPNSLSWIVDAPSSVQGVDLGIQGYYRKSESGQLSYYYRNPWGTDIPMSFTDPYSFMFGAEVYLKRTIIESGGIDDTSIKFFNNGQYLSGKDELLVDEQTFSHVLVGLGCQSEVRPTYGFQWSGYNMFITVDDDCFNEEDRMIKIYREFDHAVTGRVTSYPVVSVTVNDGYQNLTTGLVYNFAKATYDDGSKLTYFNEVDIIPEYDGSSSTPFGYTRNFYFNGLTDNDVGNTFPEAGDAIDRSKHLFGLGYKSEVYDENDYLVASSEKIWDVSRSLIRTPTTAIVDATYHANEVSHISMQNDIETIVDKQYNSKELLSKSVAYNHDREGNQDVIETDYTYFYEAYDASSNNIHTPVVQTITKVNGVVTSSVVSKWSSWSGTFAPKANYIWEGTGNHLFTAWNGTPSNDWRKTSEIISRNPKGNVISTADLDGIRTSAIMTYDNTLPILSVVNANSNEILADDFDNENVVDNDPMQWVAHGSSGWSASSKGTLRWNSFTGAGGIATQAINLAQNFAADFDIRIEEHASNVNHVSFQFNKTSQSHSTSSSGYSLRFGRSGSNIQLSIIKAGSGTLSTHTISEPYKEWRRFRVTRKGSTIKIHNNGNLITSFTDNSFNGQYFGFYGDRILAEVDNFRIYPSDGVASSIIYHPDFRYPLKSIDKNGEITQSLYNAEHALVASLKTDGSFATTTSSYSSAEYNNQSFLSSDPNISHSTQVRDQTIFDDFSYTRDWSQTTGVNRSTWSYDTDLDRLKLVNSGSAGSGNPDTYYMNFDEMIGKVGIELDVTIMMESFFGAPGDTELHFGLGVGAGGWNSQNKNTSAAWMTFNKLDEIEIFSNGTWSIVSNKLKHKSYTDAKTYRLKIMANTDAQTADYYVDGKLLASNRQFSGSTSGIGRLALINYGQTRSSSYFIDNVIVYSDPITSSSFIDATGKTLQTQIEENENEILVNGSIYDELGRPAVAIKPTRVSGTLGYRAGFASINWSTGVLSGEAASLNPADGGYPYSRTIYESNPLNRPIEYGLPGNEYRLNNSGNHTTKLFYGGDPIGDLPREYNISTTRNADDLKTQETRDKLGNTIQFIENVTEAPSGRIDYDMFYSTTARPTANLTFTAPYNHTVYYTVNPPGKNGGFILEVGTTPGGNDILVVDRPSTLVSGQFTATAGTKYYVKWGGDDGQVGTFSYIDLETTGASRTEYNYDDFGNLIEVLPPSFFDPPAGATANDFITTNTYDFLGQLKTSSSPDAGTSRFMYDDEGRLRFSQDANGNTNGYFNYTEYDGLGRIKEHGVINSAWNETDLNDYLNSDEWTESLNISSFLANATYEQKAKVITATGSVPSSSNVTLTGANSVTLSPGFSTVPGTTFKTQIANPGSKEWKKRYTYGSNQDNIYDDDALIRVEVNHDTDEAAEYIEDYSYDQFGNIKTHTAEMPSVTGSLQTIDYTYNGLSEIEGFETNYGVFKYTYDAIGRIKQITNEDKSLIYAEYNYSANGDLLSESLHNAAIETSYSYNSPGWLTEIDHLGYFSETLQYIGGVGKFGASYYRGLIARSDHDYQYVGAPADFNVEYYYDDLNRLVIANNSLATDFDLGESVALDFDANGNILQFSRGGNVLTNTYASGTNQVSVFEGAGNRFNYQYDANGNVTAFTNALSGEPGISSITYDRFFNLAREVIPEQKPTKLRFQYGPSSERVYAEEIDKSSGALKESTYYFRGGRDYPILELVTDADGNEKIIQYLHGPGGLIAFNPGVSETITSTYTLTYEDNAAAQEQIDFASSYNQGTRVESELYDHTNQTGTDQSIRLIGGVNTDDVNNIIAMAKSLEVHAGDQVYTEVYAKYPDPIDPSDPNSFVDEAIAANFTTAFGLAPTGETASLNSFFSDLFSGGPVFSGNSTDDIPDAYLNYLLFDRNYNLVDAGYDPINSTALEDGSCGGADGCPHQKLSHTINVSNNGYLYIYVSNESEKLSDVYFDDLRIDHTENPSWQYVLKDHLGSNRVTVNQIGEVEAYADYMPYGDIFRQDENQLTAYQFTGQEFDDATGLHNYRARQFYASSGRFLAVDPADQFASPYIGMGNNPVNLIDPSGEVAFGAIAGAIGGGYLGGVISNGGEWNPGKWSADLNTLTGIVGGALGGSLVGGATQGLFSNPATTNLSLGTSVPGLNGSVVWNPTLGFQSYSTSAGGGGNLGNGTNLLRNTGITYDSDIETPTLGYAIVYPEKMWINWINRYGHSAHDKMVLMESDPWLFNALYPGELGIGTAEPSYAIEGFVIESIGITKAIKLGRLAYLEYIASSSRAARGSNYVYRSLTAADAASLRAGNGLIAKAPNGAWSLEQHLVQGSSAKAWLNNPWIATSTDINIARSFSSGNGLVRINLSKLPVGSFERGWMRLPRSSPGYHFSIWQSEVSIFQSVPQNAIKLIK